MTKTIIASLVALGIISSVAAPAFAHRPKAQTAVEKPSLPKDFWEQQQENGN